MDYGGGVEGKTEMGNGGGREEGKGENRGSKCGGGRKRGSREGRRECRGGMVIMKKGEREGGSRIC